MTLSEQTFSGLWFTSLASLVQMGGLRHKDTLVIEAGVMTFSFSLSSFLCPLEFEFLALSICAMCHEIAAPRISSGDQRAIIVSVEDN